MRNNRLQGNLPQNLGNLGSLQVMDLSQNQLSGSVPSSLFSLQPPIYATTHSLIQPDCCHLMGIMPKLSALSVENNKFTGMIPTQYALKAVYPVNGTSPFVRLLLGGNYLFGPIPGPLLGLKPCLYRCPPSLFFCKGRVQISVNGL
ncbi:hypothetical protein ACHQM5_023185 [Ranunculus cassubicifolius]